MDVGIKRVSPGSLAQALEEGPFTAIQIRCVALAVAAVVLDGFDIQLLGVAIPGLMREWGVGRAAFVPVLSLGVVAMSLGTWLSGWMGDRLGRRPSLILAMLLFGGGTLAAAFTHAMGPFLAARLIASLGLGGAMPNAVALLVEYSPRRHRSMAVTGGMICTPLGGVLAGLVAAQLLPTHGWASLFMVGGVAPLVLTAVLWLWLPESAQVLAGKGQRRELARLAQALNAPVSVLEAAPATVRSSYVDLLREGRAMTTLLVWLQFLGVLTAAYTAFNWLPTLLAKAGFALSTSSTALAVFNFGGIAGALLGGVVMTRDGSRRVTIAFALGAVISSMAVALALVQGAGAGVVLATLTAAGFFIAGLQPMLFAIASQFYPDRMRASGVGAALGIGRLGVLISSLLGATLIGSGALVYFGFIAGLMAVVAFALLAMTNHVAPVERKG